MAVSLALSSFAKRERVEDRSIFSGLDVSFYALPLSLKSSGLI